VAFPPTPLPLKNPFQSPATRIGTEALQRRPPALLKFRISPRAITGARKYFSCDDPRAAHRLWFLFLSFLLPHSVSATLSAANLLSTISFSVLLPGLPLSPFCSLVAAMLAAIACQGIIWPEYVPAAFQQTRAGSCPPRAMLNARLYSFCLILEWSCRMFTRAHGSLPLPEGSSLEGDPFPLGVL
jgi:hypothetical protein